MSHAHISMFPWTTGQQMNKLTCHSRGFKGQNRILLSIERVEESNSETLHPISITPCFRLHGNWLISLPLFALNGPGWCAIVHDRHCSCELLSLAFLQRTSSRRRGRNCHVCWLVIRSQSHPESLGLKLNYTLLVPIKQCTSSLAFYLKYNPVSWTLSRLSEWWHLTTSHTLGARLAWHLQEMPENAQIIIITQHTAKPLTLISETKW